MTDVNKVSKIVIGGKGFHNPKLMKSNKIDNVSISPVRKKCPQIKLEMGVIAIGRSSLKTGNSLTWTRNAISVFFLFNQEDI